MSLLFRPDLLRVGVQGDITVVTLTTPRFDEGNAEAIGQQFATLVGRLGRHRLHLDLGEVETLTSVGLGKLIGINRKVRAVGGELRLFNVQPLVYQVFEVTHLTRLLDIQPQEPGTVLVIS